MAASNYRVVCNLHAIMVYNAEAPLDSLYGHPVQFQPLPPSSPLSLSLSSLFPFPSLPPSLFLSLSLSVSPCLSVSFCFCYIVDEDKDRERLHVSSRNTTVSTFNYTCMDTVPHKSPRCIREKKELRIFSKSSLDFSQ